MTPAEILEAAADYIDAHGWCQGTLGDPGHGPVCLLGATMAAGARLSGRPTPPPPEEYDADDAVTEYLGEDPADWNDAPGRTKDEVTRMLREVAASLAGPMAPPAPVREEEVEDPEPVAA